MVDDELTAVAVTVNSPTDGGLLVDVPVVCSAVVCDHERALVSLLASVGEPDKEEEVLATNVSHAVEFAVIDVCHVNGNSSDEAISNET